MGEKGSKQISKYRGFHRALSAANEKKKKQHNALGSDRAGDSSRVSEKPSGAVTPAWKGASKEGLGGTVSDSGNSQRKGLRRELSLLKEQTEGQCGQTTVGKGWGGA